MAEINIPGVSDKYKTNDLVKNLIELEKTPLKREQAKLETYKLEKESWQRVNQFMTSVRDSARGLYSYNNPFTEKTVNSTDDSALTAEATRDAVGGTFKVEVEQVASADKFLSNKITGSFIVPEGTYTYRVGEKTVSFNWKGGSLTDFAESLNKRGSDTIKASVVNITSSEKLFSIESLKTGEKNALLFEDEALTLAENVGMIQKTRVKAPILLARSARDLSPIEPLTANGVTLKTGTLVVPPQNGVAVSVPSAVRENGDNVITFTVTLTPVKDITEDVPPPPPTEPVLQEALSVTLGEITIKNIQPKHDLPPLPQEEPLKKTENYSVVYMRFTNGSEKALETLDSKEASSALTIKVADYKDIAAIVIKNFNTGKQVSISDIQAKDAKTASGIVPLNPVSTASDARIKYEGITMTRDTNTIDDIIPNVTLNIEDSSSKPINLTVESNAENAKNAIIEFVGNYNRLMAELNILTQIKEDIVAELEYFSDEEREDALKRLGLFQSDFTLTSGKQSLQTTVASPYSIPDNKTLQMLSQIGISTKSNGGSGINSSQMRGYLEIDEKKLDTALKDSLSEIKNLFGYDSDSDMVIDTGVAFLVEKRLAAYTQVGGILATKTSGIDTKVKSTETQIQKLETQLAAKERELKQKYTQMESTLNSLGSQADSITNSLNNQNSNK